MKKYDVILFDLDGTLTDSSQGIINSILYALDKLNITVENTNDLKWFLGPPLHESFKEFGLDDDEIESAITYYRERFSTKGIYENQVYDGIIPMLEELKNCGRRIILATSKPQEFTDIIMKYFELDKYFEFIAGSNLDGTRSKKAEVIKYALDSCRISDLSKIVMVGDRKQDINGAKIACIDSIGVLYGYGNYEELKTAGADHIVNSVVDLKNLLLLSCG